MKLGRQDRKLSKISPPKLRWLLLPSLYLLFSTADCTRLTHGVKEVLKLSPREWYQKRFKGSDSTLQAWNRAYERVKADSLQIDLPFSLSGTWKGNSSYALGYECQLSKGRILCIRNPFSYSEGQVFVEVFKKDSVQDPMPYALLSELLTKEDALRFFIKQAGTYKVMIQPSVALDSIFHLQLYDQPAFEFPVAGATNRSIQSFWGDPRDGGRRKHHGIDIFAKRGTPVVAVGNGYIRYTGERGLGGKQVWMREDISRSSIYYAHLDSILYRPNRRVKRGDTLGFVGNTGNARRTPPHLHFGVYERHRGPTDPLAFVKQTKLPGPFTGTSVPPPSLIAKGNLRIGPGTSYPICKRVVAQDTFQVLGVAKDWYQVGLADTVQGYLHRSVIGKMLGSSRPSVSR